jgi:Kip1 ubiquitination-promoting complex protein 1
MYREGPAEVKMVKMDPKGATKVNVTKEGVELDNTGNNFESQRADVKVRGGKWYYEVKLLTYGQIRIGWCTDTCNIPTNTYSGVGSDNDSWGFDGSNQKAWNGANGSGTRYGEYWNNGDVIGTVLDLEAKTISFYRNGNDMGVAFNSVPVGSGLFPAISVQKKTKSSRQFRKSTIQISHH